MWGTVTFTCSLVHDLSNNKSEAFHKQRGYQSGKVVKLTPPYPLHCPPPHTPSISLCGWATASGKDLTLLVIVQVLIGVFCFSCHLPSQQPLRELRECLPAPLCCHPPEEWLQPLLCGGLSVRCRLRPQWQELHPASQLRLLFRWQILRGRRPQPCLFLLANHQISLQCSEAPYFIMNIVILIRKDMRGQRGHEQVPGGSCSLSMRFGNACGPHSPSLASAKSPALCLLSSLAFVFLSLPCLSLGPSEFLSC